MKAIAAAPGKTILVGEHFVVYGEAAVVMAIDRHVEVAVTDREDPSIHVSSNLGFSGIFMDGGYKAEKGGLAGRRILEPIRISAQSVLNALNARCGLDIEVCSSIPTAVGLGSSGALAVATVAAVGKFLGRNLSEEEVLALSTGAEKFVHVTPSGIDQAVSTYGGVIVYSRSGGVSRLRTEMDIPIVIGNTGIQRSTGKLVDSVRAKHRRYPEVMKIIDEAAGRLSEEFIEALKACELARLGELMDIDHGLLSAIGVSSEALNNLVYAARRGGALGAKLTGAGGGGCMIALSTLEDRRRVAEAIRRAGGTPIIAGKEDSGVHSWIS